MTENLLQGQYLIRDDLCRALQDDLIGPQDADEILDEPPLDRYVTGILYPVLEQSGIDPEDVEEVADDDGEGAPDPAVAMSNLHYPSSAGITFALDAAVESVQVVVEAARYVPEDGRWRREAIGPLEVSVFVDGVRSERIEVGVPGLCLYVRARPPVDGARSVTVVLLNTLTGRPGFKDEASFFQVGFEVTAPGADFVARPRRIGVSDEDLITNEFLYRDRPEFAVGHGCAAEWRQDKEDPRRARAVSATFIPMHDVPIVVSNPDIRDDGLLFEELAAVPPHDLVARLESFLSGYVGWIEERRRRVAAFEPGHQDTAAAHLDECERVRAGISAGIELLRDDADARRAFQLANQAMVDQMDRKVLTGAEEDEDRQRPRWRPFQLAFVLLAMPSIVDPSHPDRDVVELLWFPTGGGKTEAYLALFAFTVFHRRLARGGAGGVTAIMRYTLRLLTAQQFERAARLVCACERLRLREGGLGATPITIGLFVGAGSTPNRLDEARDALNSLRAGQSVATRNPVQLHACPWCDHPLDSSHYALRENPRRVQVECRNEACDFARGLPVFVVDEDLYRERPTLVIGTVDKFAALPWRPEVGNLFNLDRPDEPPPELIIQDELHLISGPLGTMTGLYETVIDALTDEAGRAAKVIASTATIRRAKTQSAALFGRGMRQFPPPGLDPDDSWFATVAPAAIRGPRRYLGLMAPGVSHATLMIRTYAALLHTAAQHERDAALDPYWTLVGYFNSLRVLGAARMQVQDDVQDWLRIAAGGGDPARSAETVELTSRVDSSEIPERLKQLERALPGRRVLDVVLATNMISVGVDVDRLGLMAMMGQPQAAAEYIQATSRVGRSHPGLVVTLLNAARSRDRSHFEGFTAFHEALYRSVEATSVTPYSPRARDRGLHAVLIALARLRVEGLRDNDQAGAVGRYRDELDGVVETILERVRVIDPSQVDATEAQLRAIIDRWLQLADLAPDLVYEARGETDTALMVAAAPELEAGDALATMWSMRDVDAESTLFFTGRRR